MANQLISPDRAQKMTCTMTDCDYMSYNPGRDTTYLLRTEAAIDDKVNTAQETYPLDKESA